MLSLVWPRPEPLTLGGRPCLVSQYQLRDLAAMERAAGGGVGAFWRGLEAARAIEDLAARHDRLRSLYDLAESGLGGFGSDALEESLSRPEMRLECLYLSLRKGHPGLKRDDLLGTEDQPGLALRMSGAEWESFDRIAWNADPLDEAARAIDAELGISVPMPGGETVDWEKPIRRLVLKGLSLESIGDLYLSQWTLLMGGRGHPIADPRPGRGLSNERLRREILAPRRAFWRAFWEGRKGAVPANGEAAHPAGD